MRILVNQAATELAAYLYHNTTSYSPQIELTDASLAEALSIKPDTAYRALNELAEINAIIYSRVNPATKTRSIVVDTAHWLWVALGQGAAK